MRELERNFAHPHTERPVALTRVGVVGRGRLGRTLTAALSAAGYEVAAEPASRGEVPAGDAILLCVPDAEIAAAAEAVAGAARFVGHTSGATPLSALERAARGGAELFGLHPLQAVTGAGAPLAGCGCAVAGSSARALALARQLAVDLGMTPFEVADSQRAAYHAAASIASNFLVTLEAEAEALADAAGIEGFDARRMLAPLVRATVENWAELGPERALTGPVARGDRATVAAQREAVGGARPELLPLFDALVERTGALARRGAESGDRSTTAGAPEPPAAGPEPPAPAPGPPAAVPGSSPRPRAAVDGSARPLEAA
jgi:predicted short-subunit dehydrogenase-like oxidoreductase (DUF2520 family)